MFVEIKQDGLRPGDMFYIQGYGRGYIIAGLELGAQRRGPRSELFIFLGSKPAVGRPKNTELLVFHRNMAVRLEILSTDKCWAVR